MQMRLMLRNAWISNALRLSSLIGVILCITFNPAALAKKPAIGEPAPDFTLRSDSPFNLRLSEQRGHIVVAVFWSSWCKSCNPMLESLSSLQDKYEEYGVKVWAISLDKEPEDAQHFNQHHNLGLTILYDDSFLVSERYDIEDLPSSAIFDRDGVVRYLNDGYETGDTEKLDELLQKLVLE
ncbi:MAG: hypothetical protein D6160_03890 [Ketobacter sp.]|nr:MAG: hypothetical protein D6160_03890 [Ketobacter sp.]